MRLSAIRAPGARPRICGRSTHQDRTPTGRVRPRTPLLWCRASADGEGQASAGPYGLILECDGVVLDTHLDGHREAFNRAFQEIGYDCVQWSPAVYYDLLRWGDGTGQGLIRAYFSKLGWPLMLGSKDRPAFVEKVYAGKQRQLRTMVQKGEIPLRPGVAEFIDDALADGCKVVILAGTSSAPEDSVLSSAMLNLGPARALKIQTVSVSLGRGEEGEGEAEAEAAPSEEEDTLSSFERQVAVAQAEAKKKTALSFVRAMHLKGVGLGLDPTLQAAAERIGLVPPTLLAAVLATVGVSAGRGAMVAANHSTMEAAKTAGLMAAAVPPSLAARGGYSAADASFDGYGAGGGVTWRKLKAMMQARAAEAERRQQQQQSGKAK